MTNLQIQKMKDTRCLVLTKWQFFWHYTIVYILIGVSIITTITTIRIAKNSDIDKYLTTKPTLSFNMFLYGSICLVLAAIFYYIQTRRLKFQAIYISASIEQFQEAAEKAAKELNWKLLEKTNDLIIAKRGFSWKSWGELITIIRDNEKILVNSICDPDQWPSVASYGRNKQNTETYERFIKDCT